MNLVCQVKVKPRPPARFWNWNVRPQGGASKSNRRPLTAQATMELVALLAKRFGYLKSAVSIKSGALSCLKLVQIQEAWISSGSSN